MYISYSIHYIPTYCRYCSYCPSLTGSSTEQRFCYSRCQALLERRNNVVKTMCNAMLKRAFLRRCYYCTNNVAKQLYNALRRLGIFVELMKEFMMDMALLEMPVSGWTCFSTL